MNYFCTYFWRCFIILHTYILLFSSKKLYFLFIPGYIKTLCTYVKDIISNHTSKFSLFLSLCTYENCNSFIITSGQKLHHLLRTYVNRKKPSTTFISNCNHFEYLCANRKFCLFQIKKSQNYICNKINQQYSIQQQNYS